MSWFDLLVHALVPKRLLHLSEEALTPKEVAKVAVAVAHTEWKLSISLGDIHRNATPRYANIDQQR